MNIKIKKNDLVLDYKYFVFPGGEIGVKLNANNYKYRDEKAAHQTIIARLQNSQDVFGLALIKDALERFDKTPINLFMPWIPYARQDRVCVKGESFSLKVFCDYINHLGFNTVTVCDPHSLVAEALLHRVQVISQFDIINKWWDFTNVAKDCVLVSTDAGANKKTSEIAKYFNHENFLRADKLRKLDTGEILETIVYCGNFNGRDVCVIDDLCDGGKSFIELAKVCKSKNCGKFILYVTHGIFSKGIDVLINNDIDEIWTCNSYKTEYDSRVKVFDLETVYDEVATRHY